MNKHHILQAIYTTEEFNALVEERVNIYLAGYRYVHLDEKSEKKRLMAEAEFEQMCVDNEKKG